MIPKEEKVKLVSNHHKENMGLYIFMALTIILIILAFTN